MIAYTLPQAAERIGRKVDTIRRWIRDGDLFAVRNPIDGQLYVEDERLMICEVAKRQAQDATRRVAA